jgi:putative salt-induced outer membrane protein YdiY
MHINLIGYYQPDIENFSDFKLSAETVVSVRLRNNLLLSLVYNLAHNSRPPEGIRKTLFSFRNGLRLEF